MEKMPTVKFFLLDSGRSPVLDFIRKLGGNDSKTIGKDLWKVQIAWPNIGLPTCRPLGDGLYEVRSSISNGRIVRILFVVHNDVIMALHAIVKKTPKLHRDDIDLALSRRNTWLKRGKYNEEST
jgi:phage-related protein